MQLAKYTIGAKIFGAFAAMSAIIGFMGLAGYGVLSAAGNIAVTTFDGPLMAINYARAAQTDFTEMQMAELRFEHAAPAERAAIAAEITELSTPSPTTWTSPPSAALTPTSRRSSPDQALGRALARRARPGRHDALENLDQQIDGKFDLLIEFNTDHSFIGRRQTVTNIGHYKYASIGTTVFALLLAAGLTWLLRNRIVRPLRPPPRVADRIAKGDLETTIPKGGQDETGTLLNSMTVMQDNIRETMTREKELRRSAENRLADALETCARRRDAGGAGRQDRDVQLHPARLFPGHRRSTDAGHPVRRRAGADPEPAGPHPGAQRRHRPPRAMPNWNWPTAAGCA